MSSTTVDPTPAPPRGTGVAGRKLWTSIVDSFDLDEHELVLLRQAVRTVDLLEELESEITSGGSMVDGPQGRKANPAAVEARAQRITLARLLSVLRLPAGETGDEQANARPRRRVGVRGTYGIRGAVS